MKKLLFISALFLGRCASAQGPTQSVGVPGESTTTPLFRITGNAGATNRLTITDAAGNVIALPNGTAGQALRIVGGVPVWVDTTAIYNFPAGGTTGQIWIKTSNADRAGAWQTPTWITPSSLLTTLENYVSTTSLSTTLQNYALTSAIPTDNTQIANGRNFITAAGAVINLTTTGTSGAATWNSGTRTLNVPQYAGQTYTNGYGLLLNNNQFSLDTSNVTTLSDLQTATGGFFATITSLSDGSIRLNRPNGTGDTITIDVQGTGGKIYVPGYGILINDTIVKADTSRWALLTRAGLYPILDSLKGTIPTTTDTHIGNANLSFNADRTATLGAYGWQMQGTGGDTLAINQTRFRATAGGNEIRVDANGIVLTGTNGFTRTYGRFISGEITNTVDGLWSADVGGYNNSTAAANAANIGGYNKIIASTGINGVMLGGNNSTLTGPHSVIIGGFQNQTNGVYSLILGGRTDTAYSYYETDLGRYGTRYVPTSTTDWVPTDRLINVGNGTGNTDDLRHDALTILKSGAVKIPFLASGQAGVYYKIVADQYGWLSPVVDNGTGGGGGAESDPFHVTSASVSGQFTKTLTLGLANGGTVVSNSWTDETATGGGGISGLTTGRVPFATSSSTIGDDAGLFWNNTDKRLGVGTNAPAYDAHVKRTTNGATAIRVENPSNGANAEAYIYGAADVAVGGLDIFSSLYNNTILRSKTALIAAAGEGLILMAANAKPIEFYTGGTAAANKRGTISSTGVVTFNNLSDGTGVAKMVTTTNGVLGYAAIPSGGGTTYTQGSGISISNGVITNTSLNTDAQTLSITGSTLSISGGNSITLPSGSGGGDVYLANSQTFTGDNTFTATTTVTRLRGAGGAPTAVPASGLGSATMTSSGSDIGGRVVLNTVATGGSGDMELATVTYNASYLSRPFVTLSPGNAATAALSLYAVSDESNSYFKIYSANGITAGTQYVFYYHIIQ